MLTEAQIKKLIVERLKMVGGSGNRTYLDHNDGVFRGLLWVLLGRDPGCYLTKDVGELLDLAKIPYRRIDDQIHFDVV